MYTMPRELHGFQNILKETRSRPLKQYIMLYKYANEKKKKNNNRINPEIALYY